ncbi:MAG: right-handed parallel beta-helix repeat-containing protein, partial [Anaerolineales bacterium]
MIKYRLSVLSFALVFMLILSGVFVTPAYADEAPPVEPQVEETNPPAETEEEAPPPPTGETDSAPLEESTTDEEQTILEQLPENTALIVTNEEGQPLPLAAQEAQEILDDGIIDPVWCPVGVAPQNGINGCTTAYPSLQALVNALMAGTAGVVPNAAGVIWIEQGTDTSAASIILNGTDPDIGNMENFALTLQGGWNGVFGSKTIVGNSTFGQSVSILNWNAPITINNVVVNATSGVGLTVITTGNVVLKDVESNNNASTGAVIDNTSGAGNVTITNGTFINNGGVAGLNLISNGLITVKNLTASDNSSHGAIFDNDSAVVAKSISITGINSFNANNNVGLFVSS